jgi:oxygen-dependent protoporphyrinogen oxidase
MSTARDRAKGAQSLGFDDEKRLRVAVIGGGLSGLSAAFRLTELARERGRSVEVTLFEVSDRLGGVIETVRRDGYLIERGADSFLTSKPAAVRLCERLGIGGELIPTDERYRGALVLRGGKPLPVPEGFNLMSPAKVWPVLASRVLSPAGKLRLFAEAFVPAKADAGDESLGSFVRRRFGQEAFERLVQPLVGGIYTADPEKLSLAATLPRFPEMERHYGSLVRATLRNRRAMSEGEANASGARYGLFAGLREGMEQLFNALRERVRKQANVVTGAAVTRVWRDGEGWRVEAAGPPAGGPAASTFDGVVLALPAYRAAAVLSGFDDDFAGQLRGIPYASTAIVVTGHRLDEVSHPLNSFGLVIPAVERRDVLAVSFASRKFPDRAPEGRVLLRTFIGGATRPEMMNLTDEELVALTRKELASLLGVSGTPEVSLVTRWIDAMPQYHVGHLDLVRRIEQAAARHPGLDLTGSAYRGVGIPDVVADAERAADGVFNSVATRSVAAVRSHAERGTAETGILSEGRAP